MIRPRFAFFLLIALLSSLAARASVDILLVGADEATLQPVLAKVANAKSTTHGAWTSWTGTIGGKSIALTHGEGDARNAVAATTLAIRLHAPRLVVVFGVARAHDPELRAGDFVVSENFAAFDGLFSKRAELDGGSHPERWEKLPHLLMTAGEREIPALLFPADATAKTSALAIKPPHGRVVAGVLGSANQINREADRVAWLRATWRTSTEDGVSAHVAGCAKLLGVPVTGVCVVDAPVDEVTDFILRWVEAMR